MKKTILACLITLFTISTSLSTVAYADGPDGHQGQQWQPRQGGNNNGDHRGQGKQEGPGRSESRGHEPRGNAHGGERDHFAWNGHNFRRGHPAPQRFRGDAYRVHDWRARGLREPPRGQYWSYIDGNYVLIAVATGIITSIIMGSVMSN